MKRSKNLSKAQRMMRAKQKADTEKRMQAMAEFIGKPKARRKRTGIKLDTTPVDVNAGRNVAAMSNDIGGNGIRKASVMDPRSHTKENADTVAEIKRKASAVEPSFNKSGLQYERKYSV